MRGGMGALLLSRGERERTGASRVVDAMAGTAKITCAIRGHQPGAKQTRNAGTTFARCRRCGADLVGRGGDWEPVPKGFRVVWKPAAPEGEAEDERPTILICDDDPLILDLLRHRLTARGYRVELARDGSEGLARVAKRRPDAIVLDAMMPRVDGFEVLRKLRENVETREIPVIILTPRRQERDVLDALELGADDFLTKPFIPEELLSRIGRLLRKERAQ